MTTKPDIPIDLGSLQAEVEQALAAYQDAEHAESRAGKHACSARNRLTEAQRKLDAALDELRKKAAPWDTEWHRRAQAARRAP